MPEREEEKCVLEWTFFSNQNCVINFAVDAAVSRVSAESKNKNYEKAFDKCDFGILLHKLKALRISGKIGQWIANFLQKREQRVTINGLLSDPVTVKSGVPQGSVLGPLLFLILIGDINKGVDSSIGLFADDTRVWKGISSISDETALQDDLNQVYYWAQTNNMSFNNTKFEVIRFSKNKNLEPSYRSAEGGAIVQRGSLRDLGITMCDTGDFKLHIDQVATKGRQMCAWILRTFISREREVLIPLFKQLVLSTLEYCSVLWAPTDAGSISKIEAVQRAYTRRIQGLSGCNRPNYWERLKILALYSLERRRERYRILYVWKALRGFVPDPGFTVTQNPRTGHHIKVPKQNSCSPAWVKNLQRRTVLYRGAQLFNCLPTNLRQQDELSYESFKAKLDTFLETVPDEPTCSGLSRRAATNSLLDQIHYRIGTGCD